MTSTKLKIGLFVWLFASIAGTSAPVVAQNNGGEPHEPLDISNNPLFVSVSIGPNIMFTLDDSGSMQWEYMPQGPEFRYTIFMFPRPNGLYGGVNYANQVPSFRDDSLHNYYGRSTNNKVFYNPDLTYKPWTKADGTKMDDADPRNALYNPAIPGLGGLNLTAQQTQQATWFRGNAFNQASCDPCGGDHTYWPITYYKFKGGDVTDRDNYERVQITSSTPAGTTYTSPNGTTRTRDEEIQNFANWFTYHRSRILTARGAIGQAFAVLPSAVRVGFAAINQGTTTVDGESTRTIVSGVRDFDDTGKTGFYDNLYERVINNNGTPLRRAAENVGEYFERGDAQGPWSTLPGSGDGQNLSCRQSYHILMTDGYWNGSDPDVDNADNTNGPSISGPDGASYQYTAADPFRDSYSDTLADVAMYYWNRDLVDTLDNRVPTTELDPAFWQHLTTFGVGLGVQGAVDPEDAFAAIESGDEIDWPDPTDGEDDDRIDDLLHFGVNGRGGFFSASDPDAFAQQLSNILLDIVARSDATTSVAVSATRLTTESLVYAASFDSEDWSGEVAALNAETGDVEHLATDQLETTGAAGRSIFSYDPGNGNGNNATGITFNAGAAGSIGTRLMEDAPTGTDWTAENLINYLRGDDSLEKVNGGSFRNRDVMLGDIVNSRPFFSGAGNEGWGRLDEDYIEYIEEDKNDPDRCDEVEGTCNYDREDTLFIGANDGMLHAFDAETMEEFFAYVPASVHGELHRLANPNYEHRFFVDGQVAVGDAKLGSNWGTYLVGTLGAGGRGIYALDVTDPSNFGEDDVLWEFTAEDDPDLGYTFGEPIITRIGNENSGTWVAIFGNGYNSDSGQAYLYVLRLSDGDVLHKVALGDAGSNGLSGVAGWRDPATRTFVSRVYAGDLQGTMWRIDFEDGEPSVTYADGLYTDPDGRAITSTPNIAASPAGGLIAYFGTGKLIESDDRLTTQLDRFYAIRDADSAVGSNFNNNGLAEVEITTVTSPDGQPPLRALESEGIGENGWYVDLAVSGNTNGERVLAKPRVIFGTVIFSTYQPIEDPCRPGGIQRTYVLDALSGNGDLPFCDNCGGVEVGTGAPFSPPVTIRQRDPNTDGTITFPGNIDPTEPTEPGDFPGAPPTSGGNPQGWCSEFGIPPLFEGGSFLPLGTICEGRQVWREVK